MVQKLNSEIQNFNARRSLLAVIIIMALTVLFTSFIPEDIVDFGMLSMLPAAFLIVYMNNIFK